MGVHDATDTEYKKVKKLLGIPEDEPIFVLRAQDDLAVHTLARYRNDAATIEDANKRPNQEWMDQMDGVIQTFGGWRNANPDKIKVPD